MSDAKSTAQILTLKAFHLQRLNSTEILAKEGQTLTIQDMKPEVRCAN